MINLSIPKDEHEMKPRITVVGVGGAGGNAVNNMIRSNLIGCEFVVCNTDAQALLQSSAQRKIQLGIGEEGAKYWTCDFSYVSPRFLSNLRGFRNPR